MYLRVLNLGRREGDNIQLFRERLSHKREKRTRQCRKLLWVMVVFTVIEPQVVSATTTTTTFIYTILVEEKKGGKETKYRKQNNERFIVIYI